MCTSLFPRVLPLIAAAFFAAASLYPHPLNAKVLDRVVAVINDEIITLSELDEYGQEFYTKIRETTAPEQIDDTVAEARQHLLDRLINQRLITQKAKEAGITLSDQEFEAAYSKNLQNMGVTREQLLANLDRNGISEDTYKESIRSQLLRDKIIMYEVRSKIVITEEAMQKYYDTEYSVEVEKGGYHLLQIGFLFSEDQKTKSNEELHEADKARVKLAAEKARQEILDGADFAAIARQESQLPSAQDGGDIGVLKADDMAEAMRQAITSLKAGQMTPVLETAVGYQFFKLVSTKEGNIVHQVPFFQVKEEIRNKLFEERYKQEFQNWVEGIKEKSYIKKML